MVFNLQTFELAAFYIVYICVGCNFGQTSKFQHLSIDQTLKDFKHSLFKRPPLKTKYLRPVILIFTTFYLFSCNHSTYKNQDVLKSITQKVDSIRVFYYRSKDTINSSVTDKERIDLICSLIDGKVDESIKQCQPSGHILYYSKNEIIFESYFTIGNGCEQLSYFISPQRYNTKLTYRAGMFLSEFGHSLK